MIVSTINRASLPVDLRQRRDRFWPLPRQYPTLEVPRARHS